MGLTQKLGTIPLAIQTDSSNNVGIGGAANASYKLAVTGNTLGTGTAFDFFTSSGIGSSGVTGLLRVVTAGTSSAIAIGQANSSRYTSIQANEYITYNDDMSFRTFGSFPLTLGTNNTTRLTISSSGNVGIGSTNPTSISTFRTLEIQGSTGAGIRLWNGTNGCNIQHDGTDAYINNFSNGGIYLYTNSLPRVLITSAGALQVTAGASSGDTSFIVNNAANNATFFRVRGDGYLQSVTTWNNSTSNAANMSISSNGYIERSTSSLKYKKEIRDYDKGLAEVMTMRPVYYKGKNPNDGDKQFAGLIAEDIHDLGLTEFVTYAQDGSPDALAYQNMVALLTKAIQELSQKVTDQQEQINQLINK